MYILLKEGQDAGRKSCRMKTKTGRMYFKTEWVSVGMTVVAGVLFLTANYSQLCEKRMMENEILHSAGMGIFRLPDL